MLKSIRPQGMRAIGLKSEQKYEVWNKYGPYAPPHIQLTWLYSEPTADIIQQPHSIKVGRLKTGKTTNTTANTEGSREEVGRPKRQGLGDMDTTTIPEMGSLLRHAEERNTGQSNNLNDQGSP